MSSHGSDDDVDEHRAVHADKCDSRFGRGRQTARNRPLPDSGRLVELLNPPIADGGVAVLKWIMHMPSSRVIVILVAVALAGTVSGAASKPVPTTVGEYQQQVSTHDAYPPIIVAQHNVQRVLDEELPTEERIESLKLVTHIGAPVPEAMDSLVAMAISPQTPAMLREAILSSALSDETGDVTAFVISALNSPNLSAQMEQSLLRWVDANGNENMLSDVVKLWAQQPVDGPNEARYRTIVQHLGGDKWDQVLLESLARRSFYARGSAQEVLASRLTAGEYRTKVLALRPSHEAIAALQTFLRGFDYIPATKAELLTTVAIYMQERVTINSAAVLYRKWHDEAGYSFRARDYHLLSSLAQDTEASARTREQLVAELAQSLAARQHEPHHAGGTSEAVFDARFHRVVDSLSMADLWNMKLLEELLSRRDIQAGLKVLAQRDREDTQSAWGGLVFYERGRASAKQYPPAKVDLPNDLVYHPTERMMTDSHSSLCRFITHFEKINNAERVGPTPQEMADAAMNDYYGMTITRLDSDNFTAHYFTPSGVIVSLGKFPLAETVQ